MGLSTLLQTLVEEREPFLNVVPLNIARHCSSRKEKLPCSSNTGADRESCGWHQAQGTVCKSGGCRGMPSGSTMNSHMEHTFSVVSCQCALRHVFTPALSRCRAYVDITLPVLIAQFIP